MAVSYAGAHPDLPGDGITPKTGPESSRPAFESASGSAPSLSPHEASQTQKAGDGSNLPAVRSTFSDRDLGKPRDPAPRLEPHPNVVKAVHAGLYRTRQFAPKTPGPGLQPARAASPVQALRQVTIGPKAQQERDLGEAMAAYQRMQKMTGSLQRQFGQHRGRGI